MNTPCTRHPDSALYQWRGKSMCRDCRKEASRRWDGNNKAKRTAMMRKHRYLRTYGLSVEEYERLLAQGDGCCWICRRPPRRRRLAVDHCHQSGRVRGLLCANCNRGVGNFSDNPDVLRRAAEYVDSRPVTDYR